MLHTPGWGVLLIWRMGMLAMGRKERLPSGRRGILSMRGRGMQRRRHFLSPADVVHLFLVVSTKVKMYKNTN